MEMMIRTPRTIGLIFALIALGGCAWLQPRQQPWISAENYDQLTVVVAADAAGETPTAATEFQKYWKLCTGFTPKLAHQPAAQGINVLIGSDVLPDSYKNQLVLESLGRDGVVNRTLAAGEIEGVETPALLIVGGEPRGTLNALYDFFDRTMGVRWLTPEFTHIPEVAPHSIAAIDYRHVPKLRFRFTSYYPALKDPYFQRVHKMNREKFGLYVHTLYNLVPPHIYFKDHPEYFSLIDGKRVAPHSENYHQEIEKYPERRSQLCMSNEEVIQLIIDELKIRIAQNPGRDVWSVSQMDWRNDCECENCTELNEQEGTPMGSVLYAVNKIADAIGKEHPDVLIETLAYQYTRPAPKHMKPRDNVVIRLCTIECDFSRPLTDPDSRINAAFVKDMKDWSRLTDKLAIWNYNVNYRNYLQPNPNFHVLQPNEQFFVDNGCFSIYEQADRSRGGEFAELRTWMLSRLMWNQYQDGIALRDEFLDLYYQESAPWIRQYIDLMTTRVQESQTFLGIFIEPLWIDARTAHAGIELIEKALAAARSDEIRRRVAYTQVPATIGAMYCRPELSIEGDALHWRRPDCMSFDDLKTLVMSKNPSELIERMSVAEAWAELHEKLPPRDWTTEFAKLEDGNYLLWIVPDLNGAVIRWQDKDTGLELLRGYKGWADAGLGTWQDWVNTPFILEGPAADEYEIVEASDNRLTMTADIGQGLRLERTMQLDTAQETLEYTLTLTNTGDKPVNANAKIHPEFFTQNGSIPEIWAEAPTGNWRRISEIPDPPTGAHGEYLKPNGIQRWAFHIPSQNLTLLNEFDPDQVGGLLYFYNTAFPRWQVNLELLPPAEPLAPGQSRTISGRYRITTSHPKEL